MDGGVQQKFVGKHLENIQPFLRENTEAKADFQKALEYNKIWLKQLAGENLSYLPIYGGLAMAVVGVVLFEGGVKSALPIGIAGAGLFVAGMAIKIPLHKKKIASFELFRGSLVTSVSKYNSTLK